MMITVRPAQPGDEQAVADAHVAAWRAAYRHVVPAAYLDSEVFAAGRYEGWRRRLHDGRPEGFDPLDEIFVPVLDGRVVGFGHVGREGAPVAEVVSGEVGELYGFYLHPDAWGTGAADALISVCHGALRARFATACLWVMRENPRARRFYERNGWSCGSNDELIEDVWGGPNLEGLPAFEPIPEIQYRKVL